MHLVDITMFCAAESGGVRTYLTAKADWLAQKTRITHTIVGPGSEQDDDPSFVALPSVVIPRANGYRMPLSIKLAAKKLQALQPDLIEVGDPYQSAWAALRVKRETGVPVVGYYHSDIIQIVDQRLGGAASRVIEKYTAHLYRQFDLVLAPSELMAGRLRSIGVEQVRHQPLGVDTQIFSPERRDAGFRARLGLPKDGRLLVYAGRFTKEKKLPVLLEALQRLGDPYYLLMIGRGADIPRSPRIIHIPFQRDPRALASLLASCDVLVHPGDQETFGLVILEAMACGLPVLGTSAGGVAELVEPDTGLLVRPCDPAAMAEGIDEIYRRDLAQLGSNGRRRVLQKYDWGLIVPQLVTQYADLLASQKRTELAAGLRYAIK